MLGAPDQVFCGQEGIAYDQDQNYYTEIAGNVPILNPGNVPILNPGPPSVMVSRWCNTDLWMFMLVCPSSFAMALYYYLF